MCLSLELAEFMQSFWQGRKEKTLNKTEKGPIKKNNNKNTNKIGPEKGVITKGVFSVEESLESLKLSGHHSLFSVHGPMVH